jgi:hypothetical protein
MEYIMSWPLALTRFIHGLPHFMAPGQAADGSPRKPEAPLSRPRRHSKYNAERESQLLPALIMALFDFEGRFTTWPPHRVTALIDMAGLDRATGALHLQGAGLPVSFHHGVLSRGARQALLVEGLAALDQGLMSETGAYFEELSPTLRGYVLSAFERGDLGHRREAAEKFMDCVVETVAFAFLNWELERKAPSPGATHAIQPQ